MDGLTIDSEDDYIYWTDVSNGYIERANLDGGSREVILSGLDKPRAIILYKETRCVDHELSSIFDVLKWKKAGF